MTVTEIPVRRTARAALAVLLAAPLACAPAAGAAQQTSNAQRPRDAGATRAVVVNGEVLSPEALGAFERGYRVRVAPGRYWYDRASGAWGVEGGPTAGLILPGLPLGGPLHEDASNGTTGVWVNGRRLPAVDLYALQRLTGPIRPGRYWVDGSGNAGFEGGPPIVNLRRLAARAGGGNAWSHYSRSTGAGVGGDGDFWYYIDGDVSATGGIP